jgi:hypothetical protein
MKKTILYLFLFFSAGHSFAQENSLLPSGEPLDAFKDGEWFEFRIHYGIFNASRVTLELKADTLDQVPVFHAKGYGRTTGFARLFFKVEGYTKDIEIDFDHKRKIAKVNNKKKRRKAEHNINDNVQDLISAFYYLRNFYDTSQLKEGDDISLNMFFDDENYLFKLRYLGKEMVETRFGQVRCIKLRPFVQSGRVFSEQESVTLWVSDDANKLPVKMRADLRVGSIDCDLENFKNLQHPFEISL